MISLFLIYCFYFVFVFFQTHEFLFLQQILQKLFQTWKNVHERHECSGTFPILDCGEYLHFAHTKTFASFLCTQSFPMEGWVFSLGQFLPITCFSPFSFLFLLAYSLDDTWGSPIYRKHDWPRIGQIVDFSYLVKRDAVGTTGLVGPWDHQGSRFFTFFHLEKMWLSFSSLPGSCCTSGHPISIPSRKKREGQRHKGACQPRLSHSTISLETLPSSTYMSSLARTKFQGHFTYRSLGKCVYILAGHPPLLNRSGFCSYWRGENEWRVDN